MLYQIVIAIGLILIAFNLILNLRTLKKPNGTSKIDGPAPFISVLVPARNEELNIEACLQSLQQQDYPAFEIIVLDDNSSDSTADIVAGIAALDHRVKLVRGERLPAGWAGKPFACYQLAKTACGSWLLFVDADTTHAPYMLQSILALAYTLGKPSMLSGFPRQLANSLPQKVAIPVLYFIIMSWLPLWWLQHSKKSKPTLAIGQFLLFPSEEYWRIGGHEKVRSRILEDVWLGVEVNRQGGKHIAVDLSPVVSCNMYQNLGAMWEGFIKWMHSVATLSPVALVGMMVAGYLFYLAPFYWIWNEFFIVTVPTDWRFVIFFQIVMILFMRFLVDHRFREPPVSTVLHPLGFSYLFLAAIYGCWRQIIGKGVQWKSRLYSEGSGVK